MLLGLAAHLASLASSCGVGALLRWSLMATSPTPMHDSTSATWRRHHSYHEAAGVERQTEVDCKT